jgi:hypothetical protein
MSIEDYVLNLLLVALVFRQIRGKKLTAFGLLWPVALVAAAGFAYLRSIPTGGNDLALVVVCGLTGAVLGCLCGRLTRIHRLPDGTQLAKATGAAALLWVVGVGARMAFAMYAENGGAAEVGRFSTEHHITGAAAWTAALILMSLAEVVGRSGLLAARSTWASKTRGDPVRATG